MPLEPYKNIERKRVTDQIIDNIVSLIADGQLKSGDKLPPEHSLMKRFGVGRGSLREAIGALALTGVLTVQPGRGTYVNTSQGDFLARPLSWGLFSPEAEELLDARIALEQAIAGLAAEKASQEEIDKIKLHLDQQRLNKGNKRKVIQAGMAFHLALAEASHNAVMTKFLSEISHLVRRWGEHTMLGLESRDNVFRQHAEILNAVKAHDIERAQTAMREHLNRVRNSLNSSLRSRQKRT